MSPWLALAGMGVCLLVGMLAGFFEGRNYEYDRLYGKRHRRLP